MSDSGTKIGDAQLRINFDFLGRILTTRSIEEESLDHDHFIKVLEINEIDNEGGTIVIDCDIFQHIYN